MEIVEVTGLVNRQSSLEWQAIATTEPGEAVWRGIDGNDTTIASSSTTLLASEVPADAFFEVLGDGRIPSGLPPPHLAPAVDRAS